MQKNSFIIRLENAEQFNMLSDEQCGRLLKSICSYVETGAVPNIEDPMVALVFSWMRGQIDRDAQKYEEKCKANTENGKKGGRPRKTERLYEKPNETERLFSKPTKTLPDSDCDSDCEPDPDCAPVCERDCYVHAHEAHTAHTEQSKKMDLQGVMELAESLGYSWTKQEASKFLAYNIDKGRTTNWGYAAQCWESNRPKREKQTRSCRPDVTVVTPEEFEKASKYMAVVNRFREDNHSNEEERRA